MGGKDPASWAFKDVNIEAETKNFYKEFLHYDLSDKEVGYILNGLDPEGK